MIRRNRGFSLAALALGLSGGALAATLGPATAQTPATVQQAVDKAYAEFKTLNEGKNADYIPALAKVDPNLFAISLVTVDGKVFTSGKWLYHTGLPAKSGVGGGLIAVSPGKFGIAVVSPPLDDAGNSVRAQRAIAAISNALGGNPLAPTAR